MSLKKKAAVRGLLGFPIGVTIGVFITILASLTEGSGVYHPVMPSMAARMGSEVNAMLIQTVLSGVMGVGFAAGSAVWDIDSWSLFRQTAVYFLIACVSQLPIAYFCGWMDNAGIMGYIGTFVLIFIIVWFVLYLGIRAKVKKMNDKLHA